MQLQKIIGWMLMSAAVCTTYADEVLTPDERIVALTILGEARGEGQMGMFAVACVIQKRSEERKLTVAQVCREPKQFSIWDGTDRHGNYRLKRENELHYLWESKSKPYARQLARWLCAGYKFVQETTGGANHYCTLKTNPYWTKKKIRRNGEFITIIIKPVKIIGNHKFYKL